MDNGWMQGRPGVLDHFELPAALDREFASIPLHLPRYFFGSHQHHRDQRYHRYHRYRRQTPFGASKPCSWKRSEKGISKRLSAAFRDRRGYFGADQMRSLL